MSKVKRLDALESGGSWKFSLNASPKCPHCGDDYDINDHEAWNLYEEGEHQIECPSCDLEYAVSVGVSYNYSTDEQEEEDDE